MSTLAQCLESLAFCHRQEEARWAAARAVAQQDIDAFLAEQGPDLAGQHQALCQLMDAFAQQFPDESDPVLIRSYLRRQIRRIGYGVEREQKRPEESQAASEGPDPEPPPDSSPEAK